MIEANTATVLLLLAGILFGYSLRAILDALRQRPRVGDELTARRFANAVKGSVQTPRPVRRLTGRGLS